MKKKLGATESIRKCALAVSEAHDSDVYLYAGNIEEPNDFLFCGKVRRHKSKPNAMLVLTTYGGSADAAYRMMRCMQSVYGEGKITVFLPAFCKSAGTLAVVGADELVMTSAAELGPLDVQLQKPDEVGEWASGLTPLQALAALRGEAFNSFEQHFLLLRERSGRQITAKTAAEIAVKLTVGWFQPIYEQLDPMRLSETQRAMMIAHQYGIRLARKNIQPDALESLISEYPSHGFVIDREEASSLFSVVRPPDEFEISLAQSLILSRVLDDGIRGDQATVAVLSVEDCPVSADNKWEGIEHEVEQEASAKEPKAKPDNGSPARQSNKKPIRSSGGTSNGNGKSAPAPTRTPQRSRRIK